MIQNLIFASSLLLDLQHSRSVRNNRVHSQSWKETFEISVKIHFKPIHKIKKIFEIKLVICLSLSILMATGWSPILLASSAGCWQECPMLPVRLSFSTQLCFARWAACQHELESGWNTSLSVGLLPQMQWKTARVHGELISSLSQMDSWSVCVIAPNASRPLSATVHDVSPLSKSAAAGWCLSVAVWWVLRKSFYIAPHPHPSIMPFSAAPRTCATATPPQGRWCLCFQEVDIRVEHSTYWHWSAQYILLQPVI